MRQRSYTPYLGPEPALVVTKITARVQIRKWIKIHAEYWSTIRRVEDGKSSTNSFSKGFRNVLFKKSSKMHCIRVGHSKLKGHHKIGF